MEDKLARKIAFKCLVGSHNYNLNTEESDKDYKVFVFPSFDDLYDNKYYYASSVSEAEDYDCHDIRKLPELFFKSNPSYLETLYSISIRHYNPELGAYLIINRQEISKMNIPRLWSSIFGLGLEKESKLTKGTSGTKHLVDSFGYDTKQAMHAYRAYKMIQRLEENDFDFQDALWIESDLRNEYLDIKFGKFKLSEMENILQIEKSKAKKLESVFKDKEVNHEFYCDLKKFIRNLVKENLE